MNVGCSSTNYLVGSDVRMTISVLGEPGNVPVDPTALDLQLTLPNGTVIDLASAIVRVSTGVYYADYVPAVPGFYIFTWYATGIATVSGQGNFTIRPAILPPFIQIGPPTLAGFQQFIRQVMCLTPEQLPVADPVITMAFQVALSIVNPQLRCVPPVSYAGCPPAVPVYTLAVYNLAADNIVNYGQDPCGAPLVVDSNPPQPFFKWARQQWNILGFVSGVVDSSSDEGTSVHLVVMDAAKAMTIANLQNLKTPWGRTYLGFAQSAGPNTWGIS